VVPQWTLLPRTSRELIVRLVVDLVARQITRLDSTTGTNPDVQVVGSERDERT
jgi:hypothetical protein